MIVVIGKANCSRCNLVKRSLQQKQLAFEYKLLEELDLNKIDEILDQAEQAGLTSMPIVFRDGEVDRQMSLGII